MGWPASECGGFEPVRGLHEPIVSEELFCRVQNVLNGRRAGVAVKPQTTQSRLPPEVVREVRGLRNAPYCGFSKGNKAKTIRLLSLPRE